VVVVDDGLWAVGDIARAAGADALAGRASFAWVERAIEAVKRPMGDPWRAGAMVTAPIAKEAWRLAGGEAGQFPGHTELLGERFSSPRSAMLFVGPTLRVILATIHVPLARVAGMLTAEKVYDAIWLGAQACREMGVSGPRVAVAGLNPHAGEGGMFGDEDAQVIAPAVGRARAEGIDATGPWPGDSVFLDAVKGRYDLVVAMYHDQGLIPVKLVDRARAVNVTVGLAHAGRSVVRTSPAHGTAFDIAGQGKADASSMVEAIEVARRMAVRGAWAIA
jgi:4-hydroxythreonine-4-phosphate dehydrogenase